MQTVEAAGLGIGEGFPPRIMGVLNVSTESPFKPSVFTEPAAAAAHVDGLIDDGADIVDIGLSSANKRFDVRPVEAELDRLEIARETLASVSAAAVFSIETRYHEVAEAALDGGFDMVNDICGFADPAMPDVCAEYDAAVVKMASPPDLTRPGAIDNVDDIYAALSRNGFTEKTIIDPAFGGWSAEKTTDDDRETFRRLREFRGYDRPMLVSINRKNFLRELADRSTEAALPVSLAATAMAVERGAHIVRTHDVAETRDAALVGETFARERIRSPEVTELDVTSPRDAARHADRLGVEGVAERAVARIFEIQALDPPAREALATAARAHGARFAATESGGLLAGTVASLRQLADADVDDEAAGAVVDRIAAALR